MQHLDDEPVDDNALKGPFFGDPLPNAADVAVFSTVLLAEKAGIFKSVEVSGLKASASGSGHGHRQGLRGGQRPAYPNPRKCARATQQRALLISHTHFFQGCSKKSTFLIFRATTREKTRRQPQNHTR